MTRPDRIAAHAVRGGTGTAVPEATILSERSPICPANNDNIAQAGRLDQFYTRAPIAKQCYAAVCARFDVAGYLLVEPSAGAGAFYRLMPKGSLGYDLDPKWPGLVTADFLTVRIRTEQPVMIVGNPPFGKNASLAVRFFNHCGGQAEVIAMIFPATFRKASLQNRLDQAFHLVSETLLPSHAFLFDGEPYDVPAVFQIWERSACPRDLIPVATQHPDFGFTTPEHADFAIQRVGARAGRVHHNFDASPSSHYFITGPVEHIMRAIDFAAVARNTAGNPSLAKSEIVELYSRQQAMMRKAV